MIRHVALLGLTTAILLGGCAEKRSSFGLLYGDVTYDQRAALPPDAELEVRLYDLSRGGAEGTLVGQSRTRAPRTDGPAHFAVRYNPRTIDPAHTYAVRAMVAAEDEAILETRGPIRCSRRATRSGSSWFSSRRRRPSCGQTDQWISSRPTASAAPTDGWIAPAVPPPAQLFARDGILRGQSPRPVVHLLPKPETR
jgi:uncharacterized lipoprotein YbaY